MNERNSHSPIIGVLGHGTRYDTILILADYPFKTWILVGGKDDFKILKIVDYDTSYSNKFVSRVHDRRFGSGRRRCCSDLHRI